MGNRRQNHFGSFVAFVVVGSGLATIAVLQRTFGVSWLGIAIIAIAVSVVILILARARSRSGDRTRSRGFLRFSRAAAPLAASLLFVLVVAFLPETNIGYVLPVVAVVFLLVVSAYAHVLLKVPGEEALVLVTPQELLERELGERSIRRRRLDVISVAPGDDGGVLRFLPEGTITIFVAPIGSTHLPEMKRSILEKAPMPKSWRDSIAKTHQAGRLQAAMPKLEEASLPSDTKVTFDLVVGEVTYAGRPLVTNVVAGSNGAVAVTCPYNGGRLAPGGFELVERFVESAPGGLDGFVVCRSPVLSEPERAMLERLEEADGGTVVGPALDANIFAVVAFVVATEGVEAVTVGAALAFAAMGVWHAAANYGDDNAANAEAGFEAAAANAEAAVADLNVDAGADVGAAAADGAVNMAEVAANEDGGDADDTDDLGALFQDLDALVNEPSLSNAELSKLSPNASAMRLLEARRAWLLSMKR